LADGVLRFDSFIRRIRNVVDVQSGAITKETSVDRLVGRVTVVRNMVDIHAPQLVSVLSKPLS